MLRRLLIAAAIIISIGVLAFGWIVLSFSGCDYRLIYDRPSPSGRYIAEVFGADCGMGTYRGVVMLRDLSALELPKLDGTPTGSVITDNFDTTDQHADAFWDGEATFVIHYDGADAPELHRSEWGGVRIEARQAVQQP